jgi:hypothetical protein
MADGESALAENIRTRGSNSYYYAHATNITPGLRATLNDTVSRVSRRGATISRPPRQKSHVSVSAPAIARHAAGARGRPAASTHRRDDRMMLVAIDD